MRIGIAITRAASVDATWTTLHLALAALRRGHAVRFIEPWDFEVTAQGAVVARSHAFDPDVTYTAEEMAKALLERLAARRYVEIDTLDLLLLRCAPLDAAVLSFAGLAKDRGVRVVNDPDALVRVSHKSWLAAQPGVPMPPTLVTRSRGAALQFYAEQTPGCVLKPARGSGGRGVQFVPPSESAAFDHAFSDAVEKGDGYVVIQTYLPEAESGEKRLVWLDGGVIGGYLRRRAPGEFRHNLKQGGVAEATDVTLLDRAAVHRLSPALRRAGIRLAGIDMIGGKITEVNALNPGGAFHADRLAGTHLDDLIVAHLEQVTPPAIPEFQHGHPSKPHEETDFRASR